MSDVPRPTGQGDPRREAKGSGPWVPLAFIGVLALVGWGMFTLLTALTASDFDAHGQLVARGTSAGDFSVAEATCLSGERFDYQGVYLRAKSGGVRVMKQTGGDIVRIDVPGSCNEDRSRCRQVELTAERCSTFEVSVERTDSSYNKRRVWRGSVRLVCKVESGSVEASFRFGKCA